MPLRYVSFSYLYKVKSGGKVVHWTLTLSQDSCSRYEPMHPTNLSSLLLSCPYLDIGMGNWVGVTKKMQITGEPIPKFFLVLDLISFFFTMGSWSKVLFSYFIFSRSPTPTLCLQQE